MRLTMRRYQDEADYWRIRAFLREVFLLNDRREYCWQVARLDYWRWHVNENIFHMRMDESIFIWEDAKGQLAAVLTVDGRADAFFQIHPAFHTVQLEEAMLATAEQYLPSGDAQGLRTLQVWTPQHDHQRQALFTRRGYVKGDAPEHQHRRWLKPPLPKAALPEGYLVRALGTEDELPARSWASWRAFHPNEPDERYEGWEWYRNVQRIPQYRRDLDLVVVAPDSTLAGFCTIWYDDVTRTGMFEPVGVMPEYQGHGLGKAIMMEGLQRLHDMGATLATVGGYSQAANALYRSVMSSDCPLLESWKKSWS